MNKREQEPAVIVEKSDMLLDRLILQETERAASELAGLGPNENEFKYKVNMARSAAYLANPTQVKEIRALAVVHDGLLADTGENEINFSYFVRKFLDQKDWPNYITSVDGQ